jgi:uncharacterized protein with PIN domain
MQDESFTVSFAFDAALRPLLPYAEREQQAVTIWTRGTPAAMHHVEALGVPHTEVGQLRRDGQPVAHDVHLRPGDCIEVLAPPAGASDGAPLEYVLDNHLGRLAVYLRMLGFDTLYRNDYQDEELAQVAAGGRILLTRDRRLLMRRVVTRGYCLRSLEPVEQLRETAVRFGLAQHSKPFQRCLRCNTPLVTVAKQDVLARLQPLTRKYYEEFTLCPGCDQVYWKGSHYEHMLEIIRYNGIEASLGGPYGKDPA